MKYYAYPDYQGAVPYALLEEEVSDYLINEVQNGFSGTKVVNFNNGVPTLEQQEIISAKVLGKLTGSKGQKVIVAFNDNMDTRTTVEDIPLNDAPEHYTYLSEECLRKIMLGHNVTSPLLFGVASSNGFSSNADELEKSEVEAYNDKLRADAAVETEQDKQDRLTAEANRQADLRLEYDEIIKEQEAANAENLISILGNISKQGSDLSKGVAIAQIVRDQVKSISQTISATTAANARALVDLGPIAGTAFGIKNSITSGIGIAASAVGAGKAIKDILSEKKTVGSGGSINLAGGGGGAPQAPSFNLVAGSGTNQIAQGLSREPVPLRAFVVSNEVTNAQSLDRNIESSATFG